MGGTSRGVMGLMWLLTAVLACAGTLVIYVRGWSHICSSCYLPKFLLRGVLDAGKHGFLYGPRLTVYFFVHNVKLAGSKGCPEVVL